MTEKRPSYYTSSGNDTRDRIMQFVIAFKAEHDGIAPTIREISAAVDLSYSGVHRHLGLLERDGRIRRYVSDGEQTSRNIMIVGGHEG